jgi:hypothetical protein
MPGHMPGIHIFGPATKKAFMLGTSARHDIADRATAS